MRFSTRDCGTQMWKKVRIWHTSPLPKCKNIFTTTYGNLDCTYLTEKVWPNFICDFSRRMNQIFLWSFFPQQHLPQRSKTTFNPQKKFLIIIKVKLLSGQDGFQKDVFNPWLIPFHQKFRNFTNNTVTWLFKPQKSTSFTRYLDTITNPFSLFSSLSESTDSLLQNSPLWARRPPIFSQNYIRCQ